MDQKGGGQGRTDKQNVIMGKFEGITHQVNGDRTK